MKVFRAAGSAAVLVPAFGIAGAAAEADEGFESWYGEAGDDWRELFGRRPASGGVR
jgi:hypothetical protein